MEIFTRFFRKQDDNMFKNPSLIISPTGSGRTYNWLNNWLIEREGLKSYANSLIDTGKVHYVDLSENDNKFLGLFSECHTYQNEREFAFLLAEIKSKFNERVELYGQGKSIEELPIIHLIVYNKNCLNNQLSSNLQELMLYIFEKQRIANIAIVIHDSAN